MRGIAGRTSVSPAVEDDEAVVLDVAMPGVNVLRLRGTRERFQRNRSCSAGNGACFFIAVLPSQVNDAPFYMKEPLSETNDPCSTMNEALSEANVARFYMNEAVSEANVACFHINEALPDRNDPLRGRNVPFET